VSDITTPARAKGKSNPRTGLALAFAFFAIATILAFLPSYFNSWTYGVAITLFIIGIMGVGADLNKLSSREATILDQFEKGKGIFDNFFMGLGMFLAWVALYYYFGNIFVNIAVFAALLFGIYAVFLGIINSVVNYYIIKRDLEEKRIRIEADPQKKDGLVEYNSEKYQQSIVSAINIVAILVSIPASIVAVVTFLDQVGAINFLPKP